MCTIQVKKPVFHFVFGPNGSGKGTQVKRLSELFGLPAVSTGDAFRALKKDGGELGREVASIMDSGGLISDALTLQVLMSRLNGADCQNGAILDGYPRNEAQFGLFNALRTQMGASLGYVFVFELSDNEVVKRVSGRRVCSMVSCGMTYHITHRKPNKPGICDNCGSELISREDDKPEAVMTRLELYHRLTAPVLSMIPAQHIVYLDALLSIDGVYIQMLEAIVRNK